MASNNNTALLKLCQHMHQSLRNESDALKTMAEAKSVMFGGAKISSCLKQLSHHVKNIAKSFSDIDGMDIELLTSLVIVQYNVRYGVFLEQSEDLKENFNDTDATLAELLLILSGRFKLYGDKTAAIKINKNSLDIGVEKLMDLLYEELKDRYELLNEWNIIYSKDDEHTIIAFVLKKYKKIIRNQAKNLKRFLIEFRDNDMPMTRISGNIWGVDPSIGFADDDSLHYRSSRHSSESINPDSSVLTESDDLSHKKSSISSPHIRAQRKSSIDQRLSLIDSGMDACIICAARELGEGSKIPVLCTCNNNIGSVK